MIPPEGHGERREETPEQRKRRLDRIFGEVLPEQTGDDAREADRSAGEPAGESAAEEWLRRQVPPHHG